MIFSNTVNLLTVVPITCYLKLVTPILEYENIILYHDMNMTVIYELIKFLNNKLNYKTNLVENLSPILTCLIRMCKSEKIIRKYIRMQVQFFNLLKIIS